MDKNDSFPRIHFLSFRFINFITIKVSTGDRLPMNLNLKRTQMFFQILKTDYCRIVYLLWAGIITFIGTSNLVAASEISSEAISADTFIATSTPIAISFMISIVALKITAFVLGYLIVRLGHDTLIKGVTGEIDFGFSGSGFKTKLKAASPGALFVLMGAAIIIWGLAVKKPMEIKMMPNLSPHPIEATEKTNTTLHRATVPN